MEGKIVYFLFIQIRKIVLKKPYKLLKIIITTSYEICRIFAIIVIYITSIIYIYRIHF